MQDQVQYLNGLGLKAIALKEDLEDYTIEPLINDEYSHAYWSPAAESLLSKDAYKAFFFSARTHGKYKLFTKLT